MPDHDFETDPLDQRYRQAEAMVDDDAARADRRERLLARLAAEPAKTPTLPAPKRTAWRQGGWLAAASVVGLSVVLATQLFPTASSRQPAAAIPQPPFASMQPSASANVVSAPNPAAEARPNRAASVEASPSVAAPSPIKDQPEAEAPVAVISAASLPQLAAAVSAPTPPPPASIPPPPPPAPASAPAPFTIAAPEIYAQRSEKSARASPPLGLGAPLRAAAAGGRLADVEDLLAQGAPVDAADSEGETALMKSIRTDHPATAALLLRHGARLDRANRAGQSGVDIAAQVNDPALNRALGLAP